MPASSTFVAGAQTHASADDTTKLRSLSLDTAPMLSKADAACFLSRAELTELELEVLTPLSERHDRYRPAITGGDGYEESTGKVAHLQVTPVPSTGTGQSYIGYAPLQVNLGIGRGPAGIGPQPKAIDVDVPALVDTGASICLISSACVRQHLDLPIVPTEIQVNGLGMTKTVGRVSMPFTIFGSQVIPKRNIDRYVELHFVHDFHVVESMTPGVILGLDFLHPNNMKIDLFNCRIEMDEGVMFAVSPLKRLGPPPEPDARAASTSPLAATVETVEDEDEARSQPGTETDPLWPPLADAYPAGRSRGSAPPTAAQMREARSPYAITKRDQRVPPRAEAWIPVRWSREMGEEMVLDEACWLDENTQSGFTVARALVNRDTAYVKVTNFCDKEIVVPTHMPISQAYGGVSAVRAGGPDYELHTGPTVMRPRKQTEAGAAKAHAHAMSAMADGAKPADQRSAHVDDAFHVGIVGDENEPPAELVALLREYNDIFSFDGAPGHVENPKMRIDIQEGHELVAEAPRRASPEKREVIDKQIRQLLDWDVIEPSDSSTSYPVLLVRQPKGWRFCIDYRGLNKVTVTDKYPLPRADDIFDALAGAKIYSVMDAVKGYHQVEIHPDDRFKTAFTCHRGLYQYKRVPFGLKNAPAFFQRFMDGLLGSLRWNCAMVYIDDIIVYSHNVEDHVAALRTLFQATREAGLKYDPRKCHFGLQSLKLLGRMVSIDGISVLPERAAAIERLSAPLKTVEELQSFLGLMGYYRHFIPRYTEVAAPLQDLMKGMKYERSGNGRAYLILESGERTSPAKVKIPWGPEQQRAFDALKAALVNAATLVYPDLLRRFFLYIDASQRNFAAALHQQFAVRLPEKDDVPAAMSAAPLAMPAALGAEESTSPTDVGSPIPESGQRPLHVITLEDGWQQDVIKAQREDPTWSTIVSRMNSGAPIVGYCLDNGMLVRSSDDSICLPRSLFSRAIEFAHKGHFGSRTTLRNLSTVFWHPRMAEAVHAYCRHCPTCVRTKEHKRTGHAEVDDSCLGVPYWTISADLMLGFPEHKGLDACFAISCSFTKAIHLRAMPSNASAMDLAHAIEDMIIRNGWMPRRLITDHDKRVMGEVGQRLAERIGYQLTPTAPYNHQANPVERHIQTAEQVLRAVALDKPASAWVDLIPSVELTINTTVSTVTGYAPFDLLYVHRPNLYFRLQTHEGVDSIDERFAFSAARVQQAAEAVRKAMQAQHGRYNKSRQPLPELKVGDQVMVRRRERPMNAPGLNHKLLSPLQGPFVVAEVLSPHRVRLHLPKSMKTEPLFSTSHLQLVPPNDDTGRPGLRSQTDAGEWEPDFIEKERLFNNKHVQYLVKWKDSDVREWIFEDDLVEDGCVDLINSWKDDQDGLGTPPLDARRAAAAAWAHSVATGIDDVSPSNPDEEKPYCDSAFEALSRPIHKPQIIRRNGEAWLVTERPVAFGSKSTVGKEKKLVGLDLEAEGFWWAFTKFRYWLEGGALTVVTDHQPLGPVLKAPSHQTYSDRIEAIRSKISPYLDNITFVYKQGATHINVDALSRLPQDDPDADDSTA